MQQRQVLKHPRWCLVRPLEKTETIEDGIKELRTLLIESDHVYQWDCHAYLTRFLGINHEVQASMLQHDLLTNPLRVSLFSMLAKMMAMNPPKIVIQLDQARAAAFKKDLEELKDQDWKTIIWDDPIDAAAAVFMQN